MPKKNPNAAAKAAANAVAAADADADDDDGSVKIEGISIKDYICLIGKNAELEADNKRLETLLAEARSQIDALEKDAKKPAPISLESDDLKTVYTAFLEALDRDGKKKVNPSFYENRIENLKIWNQRLIYCSGGLGLVTICACVFARMSQY